MKIIAKLKLEGGTLRIAWLKSRKLYKVWWSDSRATHSKSEARNIFKQIKEERG